MLLLISKQWRTLRGYISCKIYSRKIILKIGAAQRFLCKRDKSIYHTICIRSVQTELQHLLRWHFPFWSFSFLWPKWGVIWLFRKKSNMKFIFIHLSKSVISCMYVQCTHFFPNNVLISFYCYMKFVSFWLIIFEQMLLYFFYPHFKKP